MTKSGVKTSAADQRTTVDLKVIKALGHPLRQRIIQALTERVASPSQVAKEIDEPLSNVSYHFKILLKCEAVELVRTEPVRGALEHFYRATMRARLDSSEWEKIPQNIRNQLLDQTLKQVWDHVAQAGPDGFRDPWASVGWIDLELDDEAITDLTAEIEALTDRVIALQERARARAVDGELVKTELALLHYHRA
jgi:DNA-binding transcriptional ArsR family regulator